MMRRYERGILIPLFPFAMILLIICGVPGNGTPLSNNYAVAAKYYRSCLDNAKATEAVLNSLFEESRSAAIKAESYCDQLKELASSQELTSEEWDRIKISINGEECKHQMNLWNRESERIQKAIREVPPGQENYLQHLKGCLEHSSEIATEFEDLYVAALEQDSTQSSHSYHDDSFIIITSLDVEFESAACKLKANLWEYNFLIDLERLWIRDAISTIQTHLEIMKSVYNNDRKVRVDIAQLQKELGYLYAKGPEKTKQHLNLEDFISAPNRERSFGEDIAKTDDRGGKSADDGKEKAGSNASQEIANLLGDRISAIELRVYEKDGYVTITKEEVVGQSKEEGELITSTTYSISSDEFKEMLASELLDHYWYDPKGDVLISSYGDDQAGVFSISPDDVFKIAPALYTKILEKSMAESKIDAYRNYEEAQEIEKKGLTYDMQEALESQMIVSNATSEALLGAADLAAGFAIGATKAPAWLSAVMDAKEPYDNYSSGSSIIDFAGIVYEWAANGWVEGAGTRLLDGFGGAQGVESWLLNYEAGNETLFEYSGWNPDRLERPLTQERQIYGPTDWYSPSDVSRMEVIAGDLSLLLVQQIVLWDRCNSSLQRVDLLESRLKDIRASK